MRVGGASERVLAGPLVHGDPRCDTGVDRPGGSELADGDDPLDPSPRARGETRTLLAEEEHHGPRQRGVVQVDRAREVVDTPDRHAGNGRPTEEVRDLGVMVDVLVAVGDHGATAVPPSPADDVDRSRAERVRVPHDGSDVAVVLPVLDGHVEGMPSRVEVGHDRVVAPVPVVVDDVAAIPVGEQFRVEPGIVGPRAGMRADADLRLTAHLLAGTARHTHVGILPPVSKPPHAGRVRHTVAAIAVIGLLAGCTGAERDRSSEPARSSPTTIEVPRDAPSISAAVDRARPGDLVLVDAGTYRESVTVEVEGITLRGRDRNAVVLDGGGELENGVMVLADGVTVENLTVRNFASNGVLFTGDYGKGHTLRGYHVAYVTAHANGLYGIYAFNAADGLVEHTATSGHPDAGLYVGQCFPCNAVLRDNLAESNAVGFQATNAGGDLYVVSNTLRANRVGVEPNSSNRERLAPQRGVVLAANAIVDNANPRTPKATEAFGYGVAIGGGRNNRVVANRISGNPAAGVVLAEQEHFPPEGNRIQRNVLSGNGVDLVYVSSDGARLDNCFSGNTFTTSSPPSIEAALGCVPEAQGGRGAPAVVTAPPGLLPSDVAPLPPQPSMPGPVDRRPTRFTRPPAVSVDTLTVPKADTFPGVT